MKKFYLLFVAVILAACSAEPVDNEVLSGLDANLEGKNNKAAAAAALDPMGFYSGNSGNFKGTFNVWNDCDNLYFEITPTGDAPDDVQISLVDVLPELNNGGQYDLAVDYSLGDSDNLLWTIPVSEFDTENNLLIFVKAWGDDAGSSTFGDREHQYTDFVFNFSMCGDCEERFDYVHNEDGTYTFTYVPEEDVDNAELSFTFPQANAEFTVEGWEHNGNGNAQTWKRNIDLDACTTYEWTVPLTRICMGNTGNNNIWTDFSVNGESKKGDLKNITQSCPE